MITAPRGKLGISAITVKAHGSQALRENPLDKQIAATALIYDLTSVTRNVRRLTGTGVKVLYPISI